MKSFIKFVLLVSFVGGLYPATHLIQSSLAARNRKGIVRVSPAPAATPVDSLYRQKCSKCHGADGAGDTSMGRIFNAPDFTDPGWWAKHSSTSELINAITRGKKSMPAFRRKLSPAQISSLASYVRHFKR